MRRRSYWGDEGAGILAIAEDTGRILLGLRSSTVAAPNTWGTIGGRRRATDKDLEETALREFQEETGYTGALEVFPIFDYKDPKVFGYRTFIGIVPEEIKEFKMNSEHDALAWFSYDEVKMLGDKHPGLEILFDKIGKIFEEVDL